MHSYKLRARDDHNSVIEEIDFECLSIAGALDKAKAMVTVSYTHLTLPTTPYV